MSIRGLKHVLALSCCLALAVTANAAARDKAKKPFADADHVIYTSPSGGWGGLSPLKANLSYHGGPVIIAAKVVFIFWGPSFNNAASPDYQYARTLQAYRNQFGTTPEYNTITQYSGIQQSNLAGSQADWFDTSTPPTNVTDSIVRSKVQAYLSSHGGNNASTVYEVVLPSSSYSSSGSSTSCGGPSLGYCAYHGWIGSGSSAIKYSVEPYPSCSGCKVSGWSDVQNQEHFVCHETREAVTDPTGAGWWDNSNGFEADDKCAWSPAPFIGTNGYAYQYEWSNEVGGCVKTRSAPTCIHAGGLCTAGFICCSGYCSMVGGGIGYCVGG